MAAPAPIAFPPPLDSYPVTDAGIWATLAERVAAQPFNLVATLIFALAILHTFTVKRFLVWAHHLQAAHDARERAAGRPPSPHVGAELLHFFGEIEAVFGLWAVVLTAALTWAHGWPTAKGYLNGVNYTEPAFVFVIMALAATRPIVDLAEATLRRLAALGGGTPAAWWLAILSIGPLLGSFITEPAAMTICALLLGRQIYARRPSPRLAYATLGLLFVNVSVGGTLSHFAAPPVLMVARPWGWDLGYMLGHFGWKAILGIGLANAAYFLLLRGELQRLAGVPAGDAETTRPPAPAWITVVHLAFMEWTVLNAHYPVLFLGGFLFFLGFVKATAAHQERIDLGPPLLVGFFLAGLVIHGGLQGWWIAPLLASLTEVPLFLGAMLLTAFNDNALITYLATLVPNLDATLKYAVVAGAVAGGGLTVIANAPNPAGQAILSRWFDDGISPLGLLAGALLPTAVVGACLILF
ncbi:MAG: putative Na+/H+ antiporter [Deltaproteobacteria bacterium]|nr:putative Na+/H+ antiporter [Deltaproteobacteria bacterium]